MIRPALHFARSLIPGLVLMTATVSAQQGTVLANLHTGLPTGALYCLGSPSFGTQWGFDVGYIVQPNTVILMSYDRKRFTMDDGCFAGLFYEELRDGDFPLSIIYQPEQAVPERFYSLCVRQRFFDSTMKPLAVYLLLGPTLCHVPERTVIVSNSSGERRWSAPSAVQPGIVYGAGLDLFVFEHLSLFIDLRYHNVFKEVKGYTVLDVFNSTIGVGIAL